MLPWIAEQAVSAERAQACIDEQFDDLAPCQAEPLGAGWDNTAFLVNGEWVFRFPRRKLAAELLQYELRVLPGLARRLPLPIPEPRWVGLPTPRFSWHFAGYAHLAGRTACAAHLDENARVAAAEPLGQFLAALHAVGPAAAGPLGAPLDLLGRLDPARRVPQTHERLVQIEAWGLIPSMKPYQLLLDAAAFTRPAQSGALVHGDLYVRHLLVDERQVPCGVIDWGDVHLGDPAVDLMIVFGFLPPAARPAFRRAYGPIDDATLTLARFRALYHAAILTMWGHSIGDANLVREGLYGLNGVLL